MEAKLSHPQALGPTWEAGMIYLATFAFGYATAMFVTWLTCFAMPIIIAALK